MAWREKLAICMLIFFLCGVVIFYVVIFGRLLCPRFDDAWNTSELTEHAQSNTYYSAIAGASWALSFLSFLTSTDDTIIF